MRLHPLQGKFYAVSAGYSGHVLRSITLRSQLETEVAWVGMLSATVPNRGKKGCLKIKIMFVICDENHDGNPSIETTTLPNKLLRIITMYGYFVHSARAPLVPLGTTGRPPVLVHGNVHMEVSRGGRPSVTEAFGYQNYHRHGRLSVPSAAASEAQAGSRPRPSTPRQRTIRIKLKSYWVDLLQVAVDKILAAAQESGAGVAGPVPLPTK